MGTPTLPSWIRHARVTGYATAHELLPTETALFGTESLYGDWSGAVLLLAKDFAPSRFVRERIAAGDPKPYRHDPGRRANRVLQELVAPLESAGLLYGSALANLLREDGNFSGSLPNRAEALAYGAEVLQFVVANMPRVERVVCMGAEAWECACAAMGFEGDWVAQRDSGEPVGPLVAVFHPSARVSRERLRETWGRALLAGQPWEAQRL